MVNTTYSSKYGKYYLQYAIQSKYDKYVDMLPLPSPHRHRYWKNINWAMSTARSVVVILYA